MTVLDTATHKFVVASTSNPGNDLPVNMRQALMRLLKDMGLTSFVISNSAPTDKTVLWWHKDINATKRFVAGINNWVEVNPGYFAMHLLQQAVLASSPEATMENDDLLPFYDVSAGDVKKITKQNAQISFGGGVGQIVGYWAGYCSLDPDGPSGTTFNYTTTFAKNVSLVSTGPLSSRAPVFRSSITIPRAYALYTPAGSPAAMVNLNSWSANTNKLISNVSGGLPNASEPTPALILFGSLS